MRYFAAAEARNNFLAAGQNIQSCRVYLGRVKFPYATEEEMTLMEQAIQNAFNDIQSNASLQRAHNVYQSTHKKVASLIQWFDKVINDTILKDLDRSNTNVVRKQRQLREERLELMKKKVKDAEELPGSAMSKILNLSEPQGRSPTPVPIAKLAPTPTMNALFGDVRQRITEYEDSRMAIRRKIAIATAAEAKNS
ncbi:CILiary localization [Ditylenchus destructor]|nr:CILiary localization [Ditylenchus destructor]